MTFHQIRLANLVRPRTWSLALPHSTWLPWVVVVLSVVLMGSEVLLFSRQNPNARLSVNSNEAQYLLDGFHAAEEDSRGSYRWTAGQSTIRLIQFGQGKHFVFGLHLGPPLPTDAPATYTLAYGDSDPCTIATDDKPRLYRFLVPRDALQSDTLTVHLNSSTTVVPPDTREVGLRVEAAMVWFIGSRTASPTPALMIVQVLFLSVCGLFLHRLSIPPLLVVGILSSIMLLLLLLFHIHLLLMYVYLVRLLLAASVLTLLTYVLLPVAERHARWIASPQVLRIVWGITILACFIRLIGSLYPIFLAYDLSLNVDRLIKTILGNLVVTNNSIEFRNGVTVYPPGPYITLLPGMLVHIPPNLLVQGGIAIIDSLGALTIAALARVLGLSNRTAILSALLYAAIPINLTALWWGLTAQIFGQALMSPLMIALLVAMRRPNPATTTRVSTSTSWIVVVVLLSMSLLSHIGVAILAIAWLGVAWLVLGVRRTLEPGGWWSYTIKFTLSCLIGVALIYSTVAAMMIEQFLAVGNKVATSDYVPAYWLIYRGFKIAFHEMGFWLLVPGLWLLWRKQMPRGGMELVGSWLAVVAIFWATEMMTALQVRYIYFLTPLACIGIGLLLDKLVGRGKVAAAVAWSVVVVLLVQGSAYWYTGTFQGIMMSVSPLLR